MAKTKHGAIALGIGLLVGGFVQTASAHTWAGSGSSTNFFDGNNWSPVITNQFNGSDSVWDLDILTNATYDAVPTIYTEWTNGTVRGLWIGKWHSGAVGAGALRITTGADAVIDENSTRIGLGNGGYGRCDQDGGYIKWHSLDIGLDSNATGIYDLSGGTCVVGKESSGTSVRLGISGGSGTVSISGGSFTTRAGVTFGSGGGSGTFEVIGSTATIGIGSEGSINGNWNQNGGSTLKVGIDAGGISPILIDDVSTNGPSGSATALFEAYSKLEPYFVGAAVTGKWTVMTVDGTITDEGLGFSTNVVDSEWSYIVTNNTLEVWYGMGDSGYSVDPDPIFYTDGTIYWDGEAGDNAFDNPTNWATSVDGSINSNNVLPETGNSGAEIRFSAATATSHCVYTADEGQRTFERIHVGLDGDGRLDVIGTGGGWTLNTDASGTYYIGSGGNTGIVNLDGGLISVGASLQYIGNGAGSTGIVNVANNGRFIVRRASSSDTISAIVGNGGGHGEVNVVGSGRFWTASGIKIDGTNSVFSVEGAGGSVNIGSEGSWADGKWEQDGGAKLQALVTSNGLTKIVIYDQGSDKSNDGDAAFLDAVLDVGFSGYAGETGSWDVMQWQGSLTASNLIFASSVDTNIWSFGFVDTDATNGVDTLRITAAGFGPTVDPVINSISVSGSNVTLSWTDEGVGTYTIQRKTALTDASWTDVASGLPAGLGSTNVTASGSDQEFYQIKGE